MGEIPRAGIENWVGAFMAYPEGVKMARWIHKVKVKGLFTEMEDHASVQASMNAIADVLSKEVSFYLPIKARHLLLSKKNSTKKEANIAYPAQYIC